MAYRSSYISSHQAVRGGGGGRVVVMAAVHVIIT